MEDGKKNDTFPCVFTAFCFNLFSEVKPWVTFHWLTSRLFWWTGLSLPCVGAGLHLKLFLLKQCCKGCHEIPQTILAPMKSCRHSWSKHHRTTEWCGSEGTVKTISLQPPAAEGNIWYHVYRFWWGQVPGPELPLHSADLAAQGRARWTCSFIPLCCWGLGHVWVQSWQSPQATEWIQGIKSEKTDLIFWIVTVHRSRLEIHHNKKKSRGVSFFFVSLEAELSCQGCMHPCVMHPMMNAHHLQTTIRLQACSMRATAQRTKYHGGIEKKNNLISF